MKYAVISIKPEYVEAIIEGCKTYELRRRRPSLSHGDKLIIYETSPGKKVMAVAEVDRIMGAEIDSLWEKVKGHCAVGYTDFLNYFSGCDIGYALKLKNIVTYRNPYTLEDLREYMPQYNPPQFFHFLNESHPLYSLLTGYLQ